MASYGLHRADIGSAFGSQFASAGFSAVVQGLPPGEYDITVYARSTVEGAFNQARTVRGRVE